MATSTPTSTLIPLGIDLGSSNTVVVALPDEGPTKVIKSVQGDDKHPSVIYFPPNTTDPIVVGNAAMAQLPSRNVIMYPKRALGISTSTLQKKGLTKFFNAKVVEKTLKKHERSPYVSFEIEVNQENNKTKTVEITVEKVIQTMLKCFMDLARTQLGGREVKVVLSRPQYWNTEQTACLKKVAEAAIGEDNIVDIITEPTGGQYAYAENRDPSHKTMLIVDIGAGTYDLSMIREKAPGNFIGVTTGGDDFLGGSDIEAHFLRALETELKNEASFNQTTFNNQTTRLLSQLKEVKHALSMAPSAKLEVWAITDTSSGTPYTFNIDQERKRLILKPFYEKIAFKTNHMFEMKSQSVKPTAAKLKDSIQIIYAIGGPQRDSYIMDQVIAPMFPNAKIVGMPGTEGAHNPDQVVAIGNVLWCAAKMKTKVAKKMGLPEPVHINTLSKSLGIEGLSRDAFGQPTTPFVVVVVIPSNTTLPTCHEKSGFSTSVDNQESIQVSVYQGEGKVTTDEGMEVLGKYTIPVKMPNQKDGPMITIRMEVNSNNLLIVSAGEEGYPLITKTFDHEIH